VTAMRRSVLHYYGFPLARGGVESHILALVTHGSRDEFDWVVVGEATAEFAAAARRAGVTLVPLPGPRRRLDPAWVRGFARRLEDLGTGVLHVHGPRWLLHAAAAARRAGVPVVATVHLPVRNLLRPDRPWAAARLAAYRWVRRRLGRRWVDWTVFVAERTRREYLAAGLADPRRSSLIPNGVDLERFRGDAGGAAVRAALATPAEATVAVWVGRLEPSKGGDVLLAAAARLRSPVEIWIVGDGSARATLERQAAAVPAPVRVRFLGARDDVAGVLAAADLFVLPSRVEALPMALLEALAAGLPAVVSDVGDCAAAVGEGNAGLVVPPGDPDALAAAIDRLVREVPLRRTLAASARARAAVYDVAITVRSTEAVYRRLAPR